jgi:hypothetical protein
MWPTITNLSPATNSPIDVYFVQCSLSTSSTTVVIDMQTNTLQNPMPVWQPSTQWEEMHQWTSTGWSAYVRQTPPVQSRDYRSLSIFCLLQIGQLLIESGTVTNWQSSDNSGYESGEPKIVDEFRPYFHCHAITMPYLQPFILGI